MKAQGVTVHDLPLRDRQKRLKCVLCREYFEYSYREEKGVDVNLASQMITDAAFQKSDSILLFSQDQDFATAITAVFEIAKQQGRWINAYCAYPVSSTASANRAIKRCISIEIDEEFYNACLDTTDYRAKRR